MTRRQDRTLAPYDQAVFCWEALIKSAAEQRLITFTRLSEMLQHKGKGAGVPYFLKRIQSHCHANNLPLLSALVVLNGTEKPGKSYSGDKDKVEEEREKVFNFPWSSVARPTPDDLRLAVR